MVSEILGVTGARQFASLRMIMLENSGGDSDHIEYEEGRDFSSRL